MADRQFNETRAAKQFAYADPEFSTNQGLVDLREEELEELRDPELDYRLGAVGGFARSEARPFRHRFAYRVMARQEWDWEALDAAQRAHHLKLSVEAAEVLNDGLPRPMLFHIGESILELLATGRQSLLDDYVPKAMEMLTGGYWMPAERRAFSSDQKLIVFALEMLVAMKGETIDWDSYQIPTDRFWLECARTGLTDPDVDRCRQWMHDLCEAHVAASNVAGDSGGTDVLRGHEIDDPTHFLWPITVHAFIKLRRKLELPVPTPEEVDHPLMRTSFAPFADQDFDKKIWQAEPWFKEAFEIAVSLDGSLESVRELLL